MVIPRQVIFRELNVQKLINDNKKVLIDQTL